MSYFGAFPLLAVTRPLIFTFQFAFPKNHYAKKDSGGISALGGGLKRKKMGKIGPMIEKKILPVEKDPEKLVSFVCGSNILKTGEDIKLKPDEEYPDWLWNIRTGPPPPLQELDPNSKEYWMRVRKMAMKQKGRLLKLKRF